MRLQPLILLSYARVSTGEQKLDLQEDPLEAAGGERVFGEHPSEAAKFSPKLEKCLECLRGETHLCCAISVAFGRSLKALVSKMERLEEKGVDFVSLRKD